MFDLKVAHATIVDGTGRPPYVADIGVADGRIVAIGPRLGGARIVIDGDGLTAAPGFIDVHTTMTRRCSGIRTAARLRSME